MNPELPETHVVRSPEQAAALLNPLRAEILAIVREPASAAEVARKIGDTPQRINYHLKSLEKVGLVRRVGTRQVRNLVEVLYQAIAKSFLLSEAVGLNPETSERIKEQGALAHLITLSDRIRRDALLLMEQSENKGQIPSASLQMKVHLDSEERRRAFLRDYAAMLEELVSRYGAAGEGDENAFRVTAVIYPEIPKEEHRNEQKEKPSRPGARSGKIGRSSYGIGRPRRKCLRTGKAAPEVIPFPAPAPNGRRRR